jgi:tRNA pseudouridine38-40 synthase
VVHCRSAWLIPPEKLARALNGRLPPDLVVRAASEAREPGFHARFSATARVYRYVFLNRAAPSALVGRYSWHVADGLDVRAMRAAAEVLAGTHDFAAFGQPQGPDKSTVRRLSRLEVRAWKDCVFLTVRGNAFLRQMVRAIAGTLALAGLGKLGPDEIAAIRDSRDRSRCPAVAPARGLCLVRVEYDGVRPQPDGTLPLKQ